MLNTTITQQRASDSDSPGKSVRHDICCPSALDPQFSAVSHSDGPDPTISASTRLILRQLEQTPDVGDSTVDNLVRLGRAYLSFLAHETSDRWSYATPTLHDRYGIYGYFDRDSSSAPSRSRQSAKVRLWAADRVVRAACQLGVLAADNPLALRVDPPQEDDPIRSLPDNHPDRVAHTIANWQPRNPLHHDATVDHELRDSARCWVSKTGPPTAATAKSLLRAVAQALIWGRDTLGTLDPASVLNPSNVEAFVLDASRDWSNNWRSSMRGYLRRVGRAVVPHVWPHKPTAIFKLEAPEPYDPIDEYLWHETAAIVDRKCRVERMWLVAGPLGAGLTGAETHRTGPRDLVDLDGDRLGVRVQRDRERIVPIRSAYTALAREAADLAKQPQRFFESERPQRVYEIANTITVDGLGRLILSRCRATFIHAHITHGTSLLDLREIAGPISAEYLQQTLSHFAATTDPVATANRGLGP